MDKKYEKLFNDYLKDMFELKNKVDALEEVQRLLKAIAPASC